MDLAKSFDNVNCLLSKLDKHEIKGLVSKVIQDYLTNRKQYAL